ncbi:YiiG family protein, partial [Escherichia coli]|nr:YiiG family protein [Escherichia coli]
FMKTLSPTLPELDTVGNAYGESYVDLYKKLLKLGDYLVVKETYRLDDFAQANTLYEDVKNAYAKLIDEKEKAAEAYENYYQAMHIEELELVKKEGLVVRYQIMQSLDTVTNTLDSMNPDKVDVAALSAAITKIEAQSIELEKIFGDEALLNKENMKGTDYSVKEYLKLYQQLVIELKVLEKKLNENKDISGSINTISNKYKYLIENYNSLIAK